MLAHFEWEYSLEWLDGEEIFIETEIAQKEDQLRVIGK
jgi:hypothetical protein